MADRPKQRRREQPGEWKLISFGVKKDEKIGLYFQGRFIGDVKVRVSNGHRRMAFKCAPGLLLERANRHARPKKGKHDAS